MPRCGRGPPCIAPPVGRGLHSFNFQLNLSAFYGIGSEFRVFLGCAYEVSGGNGVFELYFVLETAHDELESGRVQAPAHRARTAQLAGCLHRWRAAAATARVHRALLARAACRDP